jgi:hypothetical protein
MNKSVHLLKTVGSRIRPRCVRAIPRQFGITLLPTGVVFSNALRGVVTPWGRNTGMSADPATGERERQAGATRPRSGPGIGGCPVPVHGNTVGAVSDRTLHRRRTGTGSFCETRGAVDGSCVRGKPTRPPIRSGAIDPSDTVARRVTTRRGRRVQHGHRRSIGATPHSDDYAVTTTATDERTPTRGSETKTEAARSRPFAPRRTVRHQPSVVIACQLRISEPLITSQGYD